MKSQPRLPGRCPVDSAFMLPVGALPVHSRSSYGRGLNVGRDPNTTYYYYT